MEFKASSQLLMLLIITLITVTLLTKFFFGLGIRPRSTRVKVINLPSPNFDERPSDIKIDTIVLHATQLPSVSLVRRHFENPNSKVSSHYTIERNGLVYQHVPAIKRAWHAGESLMPDGRTKANDFSIGIELVNLNNGKQFYPKPQLMSLSRLIIELSKQFPIKYITSHAAIAKPNGRKDDPVGFPWHYLKSFKRDIELIY